MRMYSRLIGQAVLSVLIVCGSTQSYAVLVTYQEGAINLSSV